MKYKIFFFVFLAALFMITGCKDDSVDPTNEFGRIVEDQITSTALANNAIGDPEVRSIKVYLPPGYYYEGNYPVVYFLHGMPLGENSLISEQGWTDIENLYVGAGKVFNEGVDFPAEGFLTWMNERMESGIFEKMIIVMADATSAYGLSMYSNSELLGDYETFITEDLVSYIDNNYRTIARADARALMGHCQGGYGGLKLGMKHPDVFGVLAVQSPFIFTRQTVEASFPIFLAENPDSLSGPDITKFFTNATYAFSATWSPNLQNPPYFVDLIYNYPAGTINETAWAKWEEHEVFNMLGTYGANLASLEGFYFDCGDQDELQTHLTNQGLHQALTGAGIDHEFVLYEGSHLSDVYARFEEALKFVSETMRAY
jgi:S-formylglutathione hydrolase